MSKDDGALKPSTTLMLRPTTEQRETVQRREKAQCGTNDDNDDASIPTMTMTTTMTVVPIFALFYWLFIPCQGGGPSDDGGSGDSSFGGSCGG